MSSAPHLQGLHLSVDARPHGTVLPPAYTIDVTARPHGTPQTGIGGLPANVHLRGIGLRNPNVLYDSNYITWGSGPDAPRYKLIVRNRAGRILATDQATWDGIKARHMQMLTNMQTAHTEFNPQSVQKAVFKLHENAVETELEDSPTTDETPSSQRPTTPHRFAIPPTDLDFVAYKASIPRQMPIAELCMARSPDMPTRTTSTHTPHPSRIPPSRTPPARSATTSDALLAQGLLDGNHIIDSLNAIKFHLSIPGRPFHFYSLAGHGPHGTLSDNFAASTGLRSLNPNHFHLPPAEERTGIFAIPIHVDGNHWVMTLIDFTNGTIEYYDPKGTSINDPRRQCVRDFINGLPARFGNVAPHGRQLTIVAEDAHSTVNHQPTDGVHCGAHICEFAHQRGLGATRVQ